MAVQADQPRSIPAHAGEPARGREAGYSNRVYPRPRGGTSAPSAAKRAATGLSPPTRGNRAGGVVKPAVFGSIPAHAGEPRHVGAYAGWDEVYPRPRGGTTCHKCGRRGTDGLSPPTRGNQSARGTSAAGRRSIPAHAGEPRVSLAPPCAPRVYPRPRGGTDAHGARHGDRRGLSPPTRGNRRLHSDKQGQRGSIPAHAGEPAQRGSVSTPTTVYPRPRGGTGRRGWRRFIPAGLSPPTRGNRKVTGGEHHGTGSIPAHAGEPAK